MNNRHYPYHDIPAFANLKEMVSRCAEMHGDKCAFWYKKPDGSTVKKTYNEFKQDTDAFGSYLFSIGFRGKKHIAIVSENSYEWIVSYFAIVNGGNIAVPIDRELDPDTVNHLMKRADCDAALYSSRYAKKVEKTDAQTISLSDMESYIETGRRLIANGELDFVNCKINNEEMCEIVFTSGTTAEPKGVVLTSKNLAYDAFLSCRNLDVGGSTVAILPLYHTFGLMSGVLCQIIAAHPVYINNSLKNLMDDIKYAAPVHISVVPMLLGAMYNRIWDGIKRRGQEEKVKRCIGFSNILLKHGIDLRRRLFREVIASFGGNLKIIVTGGSKIDEKYIKGFRDFGIMVINGYGITECSPIVATMREKHYKPESVGCVLPDISCKISGASEILVKGPTVFAGYYKDEEATADAFTEDGWFKTGDLGSFDKDGLLTITGRMKNLILLSNGKNVSPEDLEQKISGINGVSEVICYEENDRITAQIYVERDLENRDKIISSIRDEIAELNKSFPHFKQIANIKFRNDEFPKTSTKKIKRDSVKY